jgi:hypothetical protein
MGLRRVVLAAAVAVGFVSAARAEDIVLKGVEVRSGKECLEKLDEFNWLCPQFERDGWINDFGQPYWADSQLLFYRYDLDDDGLDDAIVKVQGGGYCARAGRHDCMHLYLFGDQPPAEHPHIWGTGGGGNVRITTKDGVSGLIFVDFPKVFHSIDELRQKTLTAPSRQLIG